MKFFQPVLLTFMLGISKSASAADYGNPGASSPAAASVVSATPAVAAAASTVSVAGSSYDSSSAWNPLAGVPPLPPSIPTTQYSDAGSVTILQNDQGYSSSSGYGSGQTAAPINVQSSGSGYGSQSVGGFESSSGTGYGVQSIGSSGYTDNQGISRFVNSGTVGSGYGESKTDRAVTYEGNTSGAYGSQSSDYQSTEGDYAQQDNGGEIGDNANDGDDFADDEGIGIGSERGVGSDYGADIGSHGSDYAAKPIMIAKVAQNGGSLGYNKLAIGAQSHARVPVQTAAPIDIPIKSPVPVFKPVPVYQGISAHSGLAGPIAYPSYPAIRTAYRHSTPYVSGTLSKYPVGTGFQTGRVLPLAKKSVYYGPFRFNRPRIHAKPVTLPNLDLSALLGGLTSGSLSLEKLAPLLPLFEAFTKNLPIPSLQLGNDNGAALQTLLSTLSQIPLPSVSVNIPTNGPSPTALLQQLLTVGEKLSPTIKLDGNALSGLAGLSGLGNLANLGNGISLPSIKIDSSSHGLNLGSVAPLTLPTLSLPSFSLGHGSGLSLPGLANIASSEHQGISLKPISVPQVAPLTGPSVSLIKSLPVLSKLKLPEMPSLFPPSLAQALSFHSITDLFGSLPKLSLSKKETPKVTIPIPLPVPKRIVSAFPMQKGSLKGHVVVEDFPFGRPQFGIYDEPCNDRMKAPVSKSY